MEKKDVAVDNETVVWEKLDDEPKKLNHSLQSAKSGAGKKHKTKLDNSHRTSIVTSVGGIKLVSVLSYLIFFLPLIFCRHEPYAIFHANQSVALWLVMSALYILAALAPVHVFFLLIIIIMHVLGIFFGMYNASHNRARHFWGAAKFNLFKPK